MSMDRSFPRNRRISEHGVNILPYEYYLYESEWEFRIMFACSTESMKINESLLEKISWESDYILVALETLRRFISFPVDFIGTEHRAKTQKIGLGITFQF